jgi:DNA-binding transcriptional MerR regulator
MHVVDNALWSIGEVARKTGLSVKLIRHWSDAGVVHPAQRTPAGYRLYGTEALARLQLAQTLRGFTRDLRRSTSYRRRFLRSPAAGPR